MTLKRFGENFLSERFINGKLVLFLIFLSTNAGPTNLNNLCLGYVVSMFKPCQIMNGQILSTTC